MASKSETRAEVRELLRKPAADTIEVIGVRKTKDGYRVFTGTIPASMLRPSDIPEQPLEFTTSVAIRELRKLVERLTGQR